MRIAKSVVGPALSQTLTEQLRDGPLPKDRWFFRDAFAPGLALG